MKLELRLSESEEMLRKTALGFIKDNTPKLVVQKLQETDAGVTPELWRQMASMGWTGIVIPEQYGGAGLSLENAGVLMEALGTAPLPGPLFSSSILGSEIVLAAGTEAQKHSILPSIAAGTRVLTLALTEPSYSWEPMGVQMAAKRQHDGHVLNGTKLFVMDAAAATDFIVVVRTGNEGDAAHGLSLLVVDAKSPGISVRRLGGFLAGRAFEVKFDAVKVPGEAVLGEAGEGWAPLQSAIQRSIPVLCAYKVGGCQSVFDMCVTYTQQRVQFGQKIGRFQYVAGLAIDIFNLLESARWTTYEALWKVSAGRPATETVHVAKAVASEAYWQAVTLGHQVISGVSFSKEHELTFHLRASRALYHYLGDPAYHRYQLAKALAPQVA